MKSIFLSFFLILMVGCKSQKNLTSNGQPMLKEINCPEGGDCVFEVLKNSSLQIKIDDFGKIYPEIVPGNKLVVKYHYKRDEVENVMDGNYSEYVYFEIDPNEKQIILKDMDLQKVKMVFGRICFCRDDGGYFRVNNGDLFLFNSNNNLQVKLKFKIHKIPQVITEVNENIKY